MLSRGIILACLPMDRLDLARATLSWDMAKTKALYLELVRKYSGESMKESKIHRIAFSMKSLSA